MDAEKGFEKLCATEKRSNSGRWVMGICQMKGCADILSKSLGDWPCFCDTTRVKNGPCLKSLHAISKHPLKDVARVTIL